MLNAGDALRGQIATITDGSASGAQLRAALAALATEIDSKLPITKLALSADSALLDGAGGVETIFTSPGDIASVAMNKVGRRIKFRARIELVTQTGTDTWTFRVRIGGVAGAIVAAFTAFDAAANDVYIIEGEMMIRAVGASGSFDAAASLIDYVNGTATERVAVNGTTIDTTADGAFVVTAECSTTNDNDITLTECNVEVWDA